MTACPVCGCTEIPRDQSAQVQTLEREVNAAEAERDRLRAAAEVALADLDGARAEIDAGHSHRRTVARMKLAGATEHLRAALGPAPVVAMTVGAALADERVQRGEAVVEYRHPGGPWMQLGSHGIRTWPGRRWVLYRHDRIWIDTYALPARVVATDQADADPETRGPIAKETP